MPRTNRLDEGVDRRPLAHPFPFRQPLAHARGPHAHRGDADGHAALLVQGVTECGHEAAPVSAAARLGIIGQAPLLAAEGSHHAGEGPLPRRAVVGRVRLSGHDENLAHADVLNDAAIEHLAAADGPHLESIPSARSRGEISLELVGLKVELERLPVSRQFSGDRFAAQPHLNRVAVPRGNTSHAARNLAGRIAVETPGNPTVRPDARWSAVQRGTSPCWGTLHHLPRPRPPPSTQLPLPARRKMLFAARPKEADYACRGLLSNLEFENVFFCLDGRAE